MFHYDCREDEKNHDKEFLSEEVDLTQSLIIAIVNYWRYVKDCRDKDEAPDSSVLDDLFYSIHEKEQALIEFFDEKRGDM